MRPIRDPPILPLILLAVAPLLGCSKEVDRLVTNERLLRGSQGLGTTTLLSASPDRDTYVAPGTLNRGTSLLVGQEGPFEAVTLLRALTWSVPNTALTGFVVDSVYFEIPLDGALTPPGTMTIRLSETEAWDSLAVSWPGPPALTTLGQTTFDFAGPLRIDLGTAFFDSIQFWAANPGSSPGFRLEAPTATSVASFRAGSGVFQVRYTFQVSGVPQTAISETRIPIDVYVHSPLSPLPTGADTALVLGGAYETSVAVRAPVSPIADGFAVNDLRLVFTVVDSLPALDGTLLRGDTTGVTVTLEIHRITGPWSEGVTDLASIPHDATPIALLVRVAAQPGDSLSIPLPESLARTWSAPGANEGVLVSIRSANVNPGLVLGSRESSRPPVLRLGVTSPPPGRF